MSITVVESKAIQTEILVLSLRPFMSFISLLDNSEVSFCLNSDVSFNDPMGGGGKQQQLWSEITSAPL